MTTSAPPGAGFPAGNPQAQVDPAEIDLTQVREAFDAALDALVARYVDEISPGQRAELVAQVELAVGSDDVAQLANLATSSTQAASLILAAMVEAALQAARRVSEEAAAQDTRLDPVAVDSDEFLPLATAMAILLAAALANSAGREALRRYRRGVDAAVVAAGVQAHLAELSDVFIRDHLGGLLAGARNRGRMLTAMQGPTAAVYASEWMDKNTCKPCRSVNGKWLGNSDDPDIETKVAAVYPNGNYVDCLGGVRCRGTTVFVWRPASGE